MICRKKSLACILVVMGWLAAAATAFAAAAYTGTATVSSQSDQERALALRAALGQVIGKLAGDPAVVSRSDVASALARADRYMQSYSYQPNNNPTQASAKFTFVVQFSGAAVDALLHDLGLDHVAASTAVPPPPAALAAATAANAAAAATDAVAATTPATPPPTPGSYRLWIDGLRSANDYARLVGALNSDDQVHALRVELASGSGVQVRIDARSSLQDLVASLDAARIAHTPTAPPTPRAGVDAQLEFEP